MARPITPALAVDTIIELLDYNRKIVLIERRNPPYGWALPGGFVDVGETLEAAAIREAEEETGLKVCLLSLLGNYSDPQRDSRGHTITPVYVAEASGEPVAADDAMNAEMVDPSAHGKTLAFDHELILSDYLQYRSSGAVTPLR